MRYLRDGQFRTDHGLDDASVYSGFLWRCGVARESITLKIVTGDEGLTLTPSLLELRAYYFTLPDN